MIRVIVPAMLILALVAVSVGELVYGYPQLPVQVASHFDGQGVPNGWMPKASFVSFCAVLYLAIGAGTLVTIGAIRYIPAVMINLPHKQFWLAPERERATRQMLVQRLLWFWVGTWMFLAWILHGSLEVNLGRAQTLTLLPALAIYFGFVAVWLAEFVWHFSRHRGS